MSRCSVDFILDIFSSCSENRCRLSCAKCFAVHLLWSRGRDGGGADPIKPQLHAESQVDPSLATSAIVAALSMGRVLKTLTSS